MGDNIGTLFFKDKQVRLLLMLNDKNKEWYISDLAKQANVTYIHTSKFISKCEDFGIVAAEKHGRLKRIYLTEKGRSVAAGVADTLSKVGIAAH